MTAQLKIGTCPYTSARIKSWAAAAVVLQLCLKEFRMEIRNEALCCGKSWQKRSSDSSVFSGEDLMSSILHLLLSRKALKSLTMIYTLTIKKEKWIWKSKWSSCGSDIQGSTRWHCGRDFRQVHCWELEFSELCRSKNNVCWQLVAATLWFQGILL